ncbi:MAG: phosphosulfolactate synthase, partial [Armatimonadetes bacterium]|nr:phosphosulfolactate synthase [Armatimonadota bacterium]
MKAWEEVLSPPVSGRTDKPREAGYTMLIDKGMGLVATRDLVQTAADYIDNVKFTFGTSAFYDKQFLIDKNRILNEADI